MKKLLKSQQHFFEQLDGEILNKYPALKEFSLKLGGTPLLQIPNTLKANSKIWAKCEWHNPSGTVKDRVAFAMIYQLLKKMGSSSTNPIKILEYTGGSLGISISKICYDLKIPLRLVLSSATSAEVVEKLNQQGTELDFVEQNLGFWAVIERAQQIALAHPEYSFLYQHQNPANMWVHQETTAREILEQLSELEIKNLSVWGASIGTGGSLLGVQSILKNKFENLQTFATTPSELPYGSLLPPNGLPKFVGSGGLGNGRKQPIVKNFETEIKQHYYFSYQECLKGMREFYNLTGIKIGSSSAANWLAAQKISTQLIDNNHVLTLFPSLATDSEWQKALACI